DEYIGALLSSYSPRREDAAQFARRNRILLLKAADGTGIDVSLGALPFEELAVSRASDYTFVGGGTLRTCSAADLVLLKLFPARPIHLRDAESVGVRHKTSLDWRLHRGPTPPAGRS